MIPLNKQELLEKSPSEARDHYDALEWNQQVLMLHDFHGYLRQRLDHPYDPDLSPGVLLDYVRTAAQVLFHGRDPGEFSNGSTVMNHLRDYADSNRKRWRK